MNHAEEVTTLFRGWGKTLLDPSPMFKDVTLTALVMNSCQTYLLLIASAGSKPRVAKYTGKGGM